MDKKNLSIRLTLLSVLSALCLILITLNLIKMQTTPAEVPAGNEDYTVMRTVTIPAARGGIYDRNGVPLVTNSPSYAVCFDYFNWSNGRRCNLIRDTLKLLASHGIYYKDSLPVSLTAPYSYTYESKSNSASEKKIQRFLKHNGLDSSLDAGAAMEKLARVFKIPEDFKESDIRIVIGMLYDLFVNDFSYDKPYTVAGGVGMDIVSVISEQSELYRGVIIEVQYTREYKTPYAAHILGRVGSILAEDYDKYKEQGYPMNAAVGRDGAERAFESYLRGTDGERFVEVDSLGGIVGVINEIPAEMGENVYLTLDIKLQTAAEESLETRILELRGKGIDAGGGAAVVIDVNTGEILALASYPTYDLSSFSANYNDLVSGPLSPLFNRAIAGTYAPGSTFKMVTASAALGEGVIDSETLIDCEGIYTYFAPDYLYHCWVYRDFGINHGSLTVSDALRESCNCFFYEAGRLAGINAISEYAKLFGLGEYTGLELAGESRGVVASPDSRKGSWYSGDTLQAAIGQSENLFTPLQLANYIATIVNGGNHYEAHILSKVQSADNPKPSYSRAPALINTIGFTEETQNVLLEGMLAVTEVGTASTVFGDFPISVLGKSGSAQVSGGNANGIFVLAAPAENPEIAVAVVIEHGASGNNAARVARDILEAYFKVD